MERVQASVRGHGGPTTPSGDPAGGGAAQAPDAVIRKTQPYTKKIAHKAIWVEPELPAEIEYRAKSNEGKVRHPFVKGLRKDL